MIAESYIAYDIKEAVATAARGAYGRISALDATIPRNDNDPPLERLALDVFDKSTSRRPFVISSATYFPSIRPPRIHNVTLNAVPDLSTSYKMQVAAAVVNIVTAWFHLPFGFEADMRAYFVRVLIKAWGPAALLSPATWRIYDDAPPWLLDGDFRKPGAGVVRGFKPSMMDEFLGEVRAHRAANASSPSCQLLYQINITYHSYLLKSMVRYYPRLLRCISI